MAATRLARPAGAENGRRDPRQRRADGAFHGSKIVNPDPDKHYVLVSLSGGEHTVEEYEAMNYDVVRAAPKGEESASVRLLAGKTVEPGAAIQYRGHVLMCCDLTERKEIERFGADGITGQEAVDVMEERIVDKRGGMDPIRGAHTRYYSVEKKIGRPEVEYAD